MQHLQYPIQFTFKISSFSNDFTAIDANGQTVAYVKQKMFKLKEDIRIYSDESQSVVYYTIAADRWLDFSAAYAIKDCNGESLGKIARKGWASLWKAKYEIIDQNDQIQYHIREENGWVKVMDGLIGEIPVLGFFTGYLFNPSYLVLDTKDRPIARIKKEPSFWGRKFLVEKIAKNNLNGFEGTDQDDDERIMLSLMMMVLLERRRG